MNSRRCFRHVERRDLVPDSEWEFGYFGRHWVFVLPGNVVPEDVSRDDIPDFFELQVETSVSARLVRSKSRPGLQGTRRTEFRPEEEVCLHVGAGMGC